MAFPDGGESGMAQEAPEKETREAPEKEIRAEAPEKEPQAAPEEQAREVEGRAEEAREAPEETRRMEAATFEPEAVVEREMDYQQSEALETAFVQVVEAPILSAVSDRPSAARTGKVELPQDRNGGLSAERVAGPEASDIQEGVARGAGVLPEGVAHPDEDSGSERDWVVMNKDGTSSGPDRNLLDNETYENTEGLINSASVNDRLDPNRVMRDDVRAQAAGYMGDVSHPGIEDPRDMIPDEHGHPGMDAFDVGPGGIPKDFGDLPGGDILGGNIPGLERDLLGLRASAAPGADGTISDGGPGPGLHGPAGSALLEFEHVLNLQILGVDVDGSGAASAAGQEEAGKMGGTEYARIIGDISRQQGGNDDSSSDGDQNTTQSNNQSDGSGSSGSSGISAGEVVHAFVKAIRDIFGMPNPEGADEPGTTYFVGYKMPDNRSPAEKAFEERLKQQMKPREKPENQPLTAASLMQPPDQEGTGAVRPVKPITLEDALAASLNPYINWGESGTQGGGLFGGGVLPGDVENPQHDLLDPSKDSPGGLEVGPGDHP